MRLVPKGAVKNEDEEIETSRILAREQGIIAYLEEREGAADDSTLRAGVIVAAAVMAVGESLDYELERIGNMLVNVGCRDDD